MRGKSSGRREEARKVPNMPQNGGTAERPGKATIKKSWFTIKKEGEEGTPTTFPGWQKLKTCKISEQKFENKCFTTIFGSIKAMTPAAKTASNGFIENAMRNHGYSKSLINVEITRI
ncbi:MAG: hypothetical protein K6F52_01330 [Clostridia bacterium]|nr:hypothetical protein [Clostridia bacterium]